METEIAPGISAFEVANPDQAAAWDGPEGDDWTVNADRYDAACRRYDDALRKSAGIEPGDVVLDIGCGTGISTRDAARTATAGKVLGADLSSRMLEEARRRSRAEGLTNTEFVQVDAQVHDFEAGAFEVVISRFGSMFFSDPVGAFSNIRRAIQPGGRLAMLAWQELARNEWVSALRTALAVGRILPEPPAGTPGPFGLADPNAVRGILERAGYDGIELTEVNEPMYLGSDPGDAFTFVSGLGLTRGLLDGLSDPSRQTALDHLRTRLAAAWADDAVLLGSAAWSITARRPTS